MINPSPCCSLLRATPAHIVLEDRGGEPRGHPSRPIAIDSSMSAAAASVDVLLSPPSGFEGGHRGGATSKRVCATERPGSPRGDQQRQVREFNGYYTHLLEFASYPHIVLSRPPHVFTSFHLALRKSD